MISPKMTPLLLILFSLFFLQSHATSFTIHNNCSYTIWPAAVPGGGRRLDPGQTWNLGYPGGSPKLARIWARTNCSFNAAGRGSCLTGDCNGQLQCRFYGRPPYTMAEYGLNSYGYRDNYDISLMEGFNVPMQFTPVTNRCTRSVRCSADIVGECPNQLRTGGGCHNPCTVYRTTQYCCHGGPCRPTELSRFFKARCRDAFTYPQDDQTSTFTCPAGTGYRVVFCP